jgi:putative ABC transport system permease protein
MLISIRNTFRRKGRLALTLITLSLGGAIFIATFNVQAAMDQQVDLVSGYFLADVNLTLKQPQRISEIYDVLNGLPGLAHVEGWGSARTEMVLADGSSGENVSLFAPPSNTELVDPVVIAGRWLAPGDENAIALNERFQMDYPELGVGDTLKLKINGEDSEWTVVGFFQLAGRSSGLLAYTNFETLSRLIGQPNQAFSYRVVADRPNLGKTEQEALGREIEARLTARGVSVADITTGSYVASNAAQGFATLTGFLLFLASLTALVGSIGLAGTMSLNILERTREFGVLRAIGATDQALVKLVLVEGMLIGGISWVIAALLAFPISKLLSDAISQAIFGNPSTLTVSPTGFLLWLAAVLVLSALAGLLPARNAARLTIREVLAYE